jgi:hypothetical protein
MYESDPLKPPVTGKRIQPLSLAICIIIPPLIFILIYACLSFSFRHNLGLAMSSYFWVESHVASRFLSFMIGPAVGIFFAVCLLGMGYGRLKRGRPARTFLALGFCCLVASLFAWILGDGNYWQYMASYYDINDLDTYVNVDPSTERGQSFMDGGQVYFKESSYVAVENANAFRNNGIYCVAPIVRQPLANQGSNEQVNVGGTFDMPNSGTFDFWAVGVNCCDPTGMAFKCGDVGHQYARAGLRLIRDDQRAFFYMAVQEWAAKYGLPTKHPLFFYWVIDPLQTVTATHLKGMWNFYSHSILYALGNFILAIGVQMTSRSFGIL